MKQSESKLPLVTAFGMLYLTYQFKSNLPVVRSSCWKKLRQFGTYLVLNSYNALVKI